MIRVNENQVNKNYKTIVNDKVTVTIPEPENLDVVPENIPLNIVYEDSDLLIVNKSKGMVVHPAPGNYNGTLVNALLYHCGDSLSGINGVIRPGIVHRIDKDTSGLLIVAKNDNAHRILAEQIKDHSLTREYEAVVHGNVKEEKGTVYGNIGRHKTDRKKMAILKTGGRSAVTHYEVIAKYPGFTHLRLRLETGRTHQIRVHMASIGHPVVGDEIYGIREKSEFKFLKGQCLHAGVLGFIHPSTKKYMEFKSPLPDYFLNVISKINR
jgi:23S rRNA pseudouridine1911/1915/1917 synthase